MYIKDKVQLEGDVSNIEELYQKASDYYLLPIAKATQMYWLKLLFLGSLLLALKQEILSIF